jgi:hypothetical protein
MPSEKKLYTCSCAGQCGGITVEDAEEWAEAGAVNISFWQRGYIRFPRFLRLRWALKMLFYGEIHGDQVCLDRETAKVVAEAILEIATKKAVD